MKKNEHKGKFVAFEGLDGSGQTTQAALLKEYLENKGFKVTLTKEPTENTETGKEIKKVLEKEKITSLIKLQILFADDRKWHQENKVEPALKKGKIVITDRSQLSSFAFGAACGVDLEYLFRINEEFIEPDLIILLKVSPKVCIKRIKKRGTKQALFEKEKQLTKVWQVYEKLAKKFKNIVIVDGEKSIEEIHKKIRQIVKKIL